MVPVDFELTNWTEEIDNIDAERIEIMYAQIKKLNLVDKGIILLYLEDKSYSEIAEITGFSVSNIGTRLNRIKNKMKTQISILNE